MNRKFIILDAAIHKLDKSTLDNSHLTLDKYTKLSMSLSQDQYVCISNKTEFHVTDVKTRDVLKTINLEQEDLDADVRGITVTPDMKNIIMIFEYGCLKEYSLDGSTNSTRIVALAEGKFFCMD
jgi:hypothetical protein